MSTNNSATDHIVSQRLQQELTREFIFSIRRLIQAKELYTKELNKKY